MVKKSMCMPDTAEYLLALSIVSERTKQNDENTRVYR